MVQRKKFTCMREGLTIRGTEYRNEMVGRQPAVIVSHGFMANQSAVKQYAVKMAELGYAAFTFDFCGGCLGGKSDGKSTEMSVLTQVEDLQSVITYVKSLSYTDENRITLIGCSQGGFVSALVAAKTKASAERLILFYPAIRIPDDARKGNMSMLQFDPEHIPDKIRKGFVCVGRKYVTDVREMSALQEIKGYLGPVLILYGRHDEIFDAEYAEKTAQAYGENCTMLELAEEGHGFSKKGDTAALEALEQFVRDRKVVLDIDVRITSRNIKYTGIRKTTMTFEFDGCASGQFFEGDIQPGAADIQKRDGMKIVRLCADYKIKGRDYTGRECSVHIVNVNTGDGWKATVSADSPALDFLNKKQCFAILESRKKGPRVRIYCDKNELKEEKEQTG